MTTIDVNDQAHLEWRTRIDQLVADWRAERTTSVIDLTEVDRRAEAMA